MGMMAEMDELAQGRSPPQIHDTPQRRMIVTALPHLHECHTIAKMIDDLLIPPP